ncbi:hypothetical protein ACFQV4_29325 [Streptomyces thermocarboxydus]
MAPSVPRDADARRWIADQLTEADLPPAQSPPAEGETVGLRDLEAAGITPSVGQRTEMTLRGDDRLPAATLPPLDLARIRMTGPDAWTAASDTAAANASRRLWARAYADFTATAPEERTRPTPPVPGPPPSPWSCLPSRTRCAPTPGTRARTSGTRCAGSRTTC